MPTYGSTVTATLARNATTGSTHLTQTWTVDALVPILWEKFTCDLVAAGAYTLTVDGAPAGAATVGGTTAAVDFTPAAPIALAAGSHTFVLSSALATQRYVSTVINANANGTSATTGTGAEFINPLEFQEGATASGVHGTHTFKAQADAVAAAVETNNVSSGSFAAQTWTLALDRSTDLYAVVMPLRDDATYELLIDAVVFDTYTKAEGGATTDTTYTFQPASPVTLDAGSHTFVLRDVTLASRRFHYRSGTTTSDSGSGSAHVALWSTWAESTSNQVGARLVFTPDPDALAPPKRLYLSSTGTPTPAPAFGALWDDTNDAVRRPMSGTPANTALAFATATESVTTANVDMLAAQFVSVETIPSARTIAGMFSAVLRCYEDATAANEQLQVRVAVYSGDGLTHRGDLVNGVAGSNAGVANPPNEFSATSGAASSRGVMATMTPIAALAGDVLVVGLGARGWDTSATARSIGLRIGDPTGTADLDLAFGVTTDLRPWVQFSVDPFALYVPEDPLDVDETHTATTIELTWTPPAGGYPPDSYEVRIDAGTPVDVALATSYEWTGLTPATLYDVEVRAIGPDGASAWVGLAVTTTSVDFPPPVPGVASQAILDRLGLDPTPGGDDQPLFQWHTLDGGWSTHDAYSAALVSYTITYGRAGAFDLPDTAQATIVLARALAGTPPQLADRVRLALCPPAASALGIDGARFTGEVTDVEDDTVSGLVTVTAAGMHGRRSRRTIGIAGWPTEDDGARAARILGAVGSDVGTVDAGVFDLVGPSQDATVAQLLDTTAASSGGLLVEQPDGAVDWHDAEHRRGTPVAVTLEAADVIDTLKWSQHVGDILNAVTVTHAAGERLITDPASVARHEQAPAKVDTHLADAVDASIRGSRIVSRRAWPSWQLPDLVVDLVRTLNPSSLAAVLELRLGSRVAVDGLTSGPYGPTVTLYAEGWTETAQVDAWRLSVPVSDTRAAGVPIRWIDVDPAVSWAEATPTWLEAGLIEDPDEIDD